MPPLSSVNIAALDRDGCGVQAVFTWRGDRYEHSIVVVTGGHATPLLEADSVPPLQEAVRHQLKDSRPSLLFTGAGEGRYWSATVTPITDIHFALLGFDFACRRGRDASMPVVAYRVAEGVAVENHAGESEVLLRAKDQREFVVRARAMPTNLSTEGVATCRLALDGQCLTIEALGSPQVTSGATIQWRYEIAAIRAR